MNLESEIVFGVMVLSAFSTVFTEFWQAVSASAAAIQSVMLIFFMLVFLILI
jgi:hypothetical protein